jgi:hypothetical protein
MAYLSSDFSKVAATAFIFGLMSCLALGADIPVISAGPDGLESVRMLPRGTYSRVVGAAVAAVHDSVLPELGCSDTSAQGSAHWKLHTVIVGVGIGAELGLGPIFSIQAKPRIRLLYTRADAPVFPIQ